MVQKKVMISLPEETLKDVDGLVKAGFYRTRSDLIYEAVMKIDPIKILAERRTDARLKEMLDTVKGITKPIHDCSKQR